MNVARRGAPDYTTMTAAQYKAALDAALAVDVRVGGWFAPHQVYAGSPQPDLAVEIDAGWVFDPSTQTLTEVAMQTVTGFTVPSAGQNRVDRVVIDASTGVAARVAGTAVTGSPTATPPAIPDGYLPCAQVLITSADSSITNSMITDERALPTKGQAFASQSEVDAMTSQVKAINPYHNRISLASVQAGGSPSSAVAVDFLGIPSGVRRITLVLDAFTTNGTSNYMVQIGDSGGFANSGYVSGAGQFGGPGATNNTTGFLCSYIIEATTGSNGAITLTKMKDHTWACVSGLTQDGTTRVNFGAGTKSLSGELDRIRITAVNGTDVIDGGNIGLAYER